MYLLFLVIYQAQENFFEHTSKQWEDSWKYGMQSGVLGELWDVQKCDQTVFKSKL